MWPVNGTAIGATNMYGGGQEEIAPILKEGRRGTLNWMIQRGMELCGDRPPTGEAPPEWWPGFGPGRAYLQ